MKKIAPQKKNIKKTRTKFCSTASSPWRAATLGVIFVLPFCNTALYTSCLLSISKKKIGKFLCGLFSKNTWPQTESYKKYYDDGMKTTNNKLLRQNQRVKNV